MYSGGYDIALQINEEVFNKVLAALYYKGLFYVKKDFKLQSDKLPTALTDLTEVTYKVKLISAPLLDFMADDTANILLNSQVIFYLLGNIEVKLEADLGATVKVVYDNKTHAVQLDFKNALITAINFNNKFGLDDATLKRINEVIKYIVINDLLSNMENIAVPLSIFQLKVPTVPESITLNVNRFDCEIIDSSLFKAGIDLFHNNTGAFAAIKLGATADYSMAITEKVIQQIIDFWWLNTTINKSITKEETDKLNKIESFVNDAIKLAEDVLLVTTLGVIDKDTTFSNTELNYGATISFNKPTIDLSAGNEFSIVNTNVGVYVWAKITTDITSTTEVFWGLWKVSSTTLTNQKLIDITDNIIVTLKNVKGKVYLNKDLELKGKVLQVDLDINFGNSLFEKLTTATVDTIKNWVKDLIISKLPELTLFPKVINVDLKSLGYDAEIDPQELSTTNDEVRIGLNLGVKELKKITTALPGFIANKFSMEVHRNSCDELDKMDESNKVGYFVLLDALNDGYDTCGECMPWYSKR